MTSTHLQQSRRWTSLTNIQSYLENYCVEDNSCMMSAVQSQTALVSKLEALQCHFTWDLDPGRSELFRRTAKLEDIGKEEGNSWLGHIYNLRGFVQYKLGFTEDALSLFNKAAEDFSQIRNTDKGPWLVVNYGNLAWLHHHLGDQAESQAYLSKVDALMNEYPSPSQEELHPEIYAEKAWTFMKFSADKKQLAAEYFQRAIRMQPDMVEWHTSHAIVLVNIHRYTHTELEADIWEKMRVAKEQDPENLYLAALHLEQCGKKGERVEDEARELSRKVLRNPVSSYSGIKPLLRVYRQCKGLSVDEAIDVAEEALENHPDERFLKRCVADFYKIIIFKGHRKQPIIDRAISLLKEVICLYPHSSVMKRTDLAMIHAKSNDGWAKTEQIYKELLESDLEPLDKQMVYHDYANCIFFILHDTDRSARYHMKAAAIPQPSRNREKSITVLVKIKDRGRSPICGEIEEFLANLPEL